jgi:ATP-dependent Clp protease adaptor protein ClpS
MSMPGLERDTDTVVEEKAKAQTNSKVVIYNDDTHTYDYVVEVLTKCCKLTKDQAFRCAVETDMTGRSMVFFGSKEKCEDVCNKILDYGPDHRMDKSMTSLDAAVESK